MPARGLHAARVYPVAGKVGVGSAGLRPAPAEAVVPAAGRQPQQQQRGFRGMAGWVRLRGTP
ncbi:hypothetical protein CR156_20985 [Stenotrophomonas lactitubi]|nr:hypothetical protein CR156_20985 [Stenotrophomonas lactitubi]